jgi:hypothetical protein
MDDETEKKPEDDVIFRFFDGSKTRAIDLWDFTLEISDQFDEAFQQTVDQVEKGNLKAAKAVIDKTRGLLGIEKFKEVDGVQSGLPSPKVLEIFYQLMVAIDSSKKAIESNPILQGATESLSSNSRENNNSDCGSISSDSNSETPLPPPSELPPASEPTN